MPGSDPDGSSRPPARFQYRVRLRTRLFFDLFNIGNSHASETISRATGAGFQRPANILAPFTTRLGFRLLW